MTFYLATAAVLITIAIINERRTKSYIEYLTKRNKK